MTLTRRAIRSAATAILALGVVAAVAAGALTVFRQTTGADPSDAFKAVPLLPATDGELTTWMAETDPLDRAVEPNTRILVEAAWVRAWSRLGLASTAQSPEDLRTWFTGPAYDNALLAVSNGTEVGVEQHGHELRVTFYSVDGSVLGIEADSELTRTIDGTAVRTLETLEAVLLLSDGNWRIHQLTRTGVELRNT